MKTTTVTYKYEFSLAAGGNELAQCSRPSISAYSGSAPTGKITKFEYPGSSYTSSNSYMGIAVTDVVSYTNQSNRPFLSISAATTGTGTTQPYAESVKMPSMTYSNEGVYKIGSTTYCSSRMNMGSSYSKSASEPPTLYAKLTNRNIVGAYVIVYVTYKVTYTSSYTITWSLGMGDEWEDGSTEDKTTTITPGSDATPPSVPCYHYYSGNTLSTFTFNGWTFENRYGSTVIGKTSIPANKITGDMTLYPQWLPKVSLSSVSGTVGTTQTATLECLPPYIAVTSYLKSPLKGTILNSNTSYFTTSITPIATSTNRSTYTISVTLSAICSNKTYTLQPVRAMSSTTGRPFASPEYFANFPSTVTGSVTAVGKTGKTGVSTDDVHVVYGSSKTITRTASGNTGTISATSSNTSFATVSVSGSTITVTIVGNPDNNCIITVKSAATTTHTEATSTFKVYYDKADNPITISSTSGTIYFHGSHTYNNTVQVHVKNPQGTVSYSSSDTGKATVDANGKVTAKGAGTATITATASGNTNYKSGRATYTVKIVADTYTDTWNNPSISQYSYSNIGAGGGTSTPTVKASQSGTRNWVSGYSETLSNSTFNYSYSMTTGNGFSINTTNGNITADSRGTTTGSERSSNTATVTVTGSGSKSNTKTAVCKQNANALTNTNYSPSNYTVSVSIGNGLTAGGGSATVTASASHKAYDYYTSGSYTNQHTVTDSVTWSITTQTFTPSGGSASTITRFSKSGNTLSHASMTSNVGTDYVKITATNSSNTSTISTAEKSITNELGTQKYKNTSGTTGYNIVYTVPTVTIGSGLSAAGGTATVTCSVTNNTNWYQKYTSGTYTSQKTSTETGTARWRITSNGNSRFSHPSSGGTSLSGVGTVYNTGTKISHSNMTTNATTDTVTVTAYNIGDISKTKTASASVSNALTGISISLGNNPINYNTTTTATVTATYTSGSSKDVTSSLSTSSSATSNYIKSGNTNIVTVS